MYMETDKNLHAGHRERAVKKFLTNPDSFSDHELLEVLLFYALPRRDTNALAHRIIKYFGSLEKVFSAPLESLKAVDGVGDRVATELLVIGTMYKRLRAEKQPLKTYCSFDSVRERMIGYFRNQRNISAYKLGMELGHSKTYFYRIESGEIQLTLDMLLEVLDVLQVTTAEFFCPTLKEDDKVLFDMISDLSPENKQTIIDLIKKLK